MLLADQTTSMVVQTATLIAPVAIYFFILGLLNSRRTPQILSSRTDFFILFVLIGPVFIFPVLSLMSIHFGVSIIVTVLLAGLVWLLSGRAGGWVVYNVSPEDSHKIISDVLDDMGFAFTRISNEYRITGRRMVISVNAFGLLRNVSVRMHDAEQSEMLEFENRLIARFSNIPSRPTPMAATLLLLATAMLTAPMIMVAHHAPEIARIISDFWK